MVVLCARVESVSRTVGRVRPASVAQNGTYQRPRRHTTAGWAEKCDVIDENLQIAVAVLAFFTKQFKSGPSVSCKALSSLTIINNEKLIKSNFLFKSVTSRAPLAPKHKDERPLPTPPLPCTFPSRWSKVDKPGEWHNYLWPPWLVEPRQTLSGLVRLVVWYAAEQKSLLSGRFSSFSNF